GESSRGARRGLVRRPPVRQGWRGGRRRGRAGGVAVGPIELCEVVGIGPLKPQLCRSRCPVAAGGGRRRPVMAGGARRCPVSPTAPDGVKWRGFGAPSDGWLCRSTHATP